MPQPLTYRHTDTAPGAPRLETWFFDSKCLRFKGHYLGQCLLTTLAMLAILQVLDVFTDTAVVAALGASAIIAFTMPHAQVSRPRFLIGGYAAGIAAGWSCSLPAALPCWSQLGVTNPDPEIFFSALAVGFAIFIMVATNTEHPPAASLALGIALHDGSARTLVVVLAGIVTLAGTKAILKPLLRNLL